MRIRLRADRLVAVARASKRRLEALATALSVAARPFHRKALLRLAVRYRACLPGVTFIGVTGSCGKTTTKELIAVVLSSQLKGRRNRDTHNTVSQIARGLWAARPWHDFYVQEIGASLSNEMVRFEVPLSMVRPSIGVVTNIGTDHISAYHTMETIAAEKGKLIAALPPQGTAVLNADDPKVSAMQARCAGRVITYGLAPGAMLRAVDVHSSWPDRLSFTALYQGQSQVVRTQLCGEHLVSCVLAALAVGIAMGIPLGRAAQAVETMAPFKGRMSPVSRPDGITFIRDDIKAPFWSIPAALQFMKNARAKRKIVVLGSISDFTGNSDRRYVTVARKALAVADRVIFVGPHASKCLPAGRDSQAGPLSAFYSIEAACEHVRDILKPGDLVLLKGGARDKLNWLIVTPRNRPAGGLDASVGEPGSDAAEQTPNAVARAVVGLGNPGERFRATPHNLGQEVVDILARSLGGGWVREEEALVARMQTAGATVYLIKPQTSMNDSGPVLVRLSQRLGLEPASCILVHDDVDLALGVVRARMSGGDGGHRGVRSVLEALRTDGVPRVKIGVGRPTAQEKVAAHRLLAAFSEAEAPVIETACAEAAKRVLELLRTLARPAFTPRETGKGTLVSSRPK